MSPFGHLCLGTADVEALQGVPVAPRAVTVRVDYPGYGLNAEVAIAICRVARERGGRVFDVDAVVGVSVREVAQEQRVRVLLLHEDAIPAVARDPVAGDLVRIGVVEAQPAF